MSQENVETVKQAVAGINERDIDRGCASPQVPLGRTGKSRDGRLRWVWAVRLQSERVGQSPGEALRLARAGLLAGGEKASTFLRRAAV